MRKIVKILFSIILSLILTAALYIGLNNKVPSIKFWGTRILIVSSGSMSPELSLGDIIIIKEYSDYNVGDIVTYNVDNQYLVTHRIIEKNGEQFVTKGDNNNTEDKELVKKNNIEGKVICNSKILKFVYSHWLISIFIVLLLFIIF